MWESQCWCGLNPSEKYESQLGWLFPIYGQVKLMFQTTNQQWHLRWFRGCFFCFPTLTNDWGQSVTYQSFCIIIPHGETSSETSTATWPKKTYRKWGPQRIARVVYKFNSSGLCCICMYYIYIWVDYNMSLTWIVGPLGDDSPPTNHYIPGFGRTGFGS